MVATAFHLTADELRSDLRPTVILNEIKKITKGDVRPAQSSRVARPPADLNAFAELQWKCLVVDENSKKIIDNVVKEDDILNNNIASMLPQPTHARLHSLTTNSNRANRKPPRAEP